jgi:1-deoxy-D-xylulose-5-phosphate synthase
MLATALAHNGPIAFRNHGGIAAGVKVENEIIPIPIGKGEILTGGDDLLILAIGRSVGEALIAHETLLKRGISSTVVNCRFVKPLDADLIGSLVKKIPRVITMEENVRQGGFGSAVLECLSDQGITNFCMERLGIPDLFVETRPATPYPIQIQYRCIGHRPYSRKTAESLQSSLHDRFGAFLT